MSVPVAVANYVPVDRAGAGRGRIAASMTYYARRPGRDLEERRAEWDAPGAARRGLGGLGGGGHVGPPGGGRARAGGSGNKGLPVARPVTAE